eukprot:13731874-Ditylum_brightwellii.AAC.1
MTTLFMALQGKFTISSTKTVTDIMGALLMGNLKVNFYPYGRRDGSMVTEMETVDIAMGMTGTAHILCIVTNYVDKS